jgi:hypothetical protein
VSREPTIPFSARKCVWWRGQLARYDTAIGQIEAVQDGVILVRDPDQGTLYELSEAEAQALEDALRHARQGVAQWKVNASGFNKIRIGLRIDGSVVVTWRGRTRPMRLSRQRGSEYNVVSLADGTRRSQRIFRACSACKGVSRELYIAADIVRENGSRVVHVGVCPACVETRSNRCDDHEECRETLSMAFACWCSKNPDGPWAEPKAQPGLAVQEL